MSALLLTALLAATPGLPLLLGAAWLFPRLRGLAVACAPWGAFPALLLVLFGPEQAEASFPGAFTGMRLALDGMGRASLAPTCVLWLAAGAFARAYHAADPRRDAFFGFFVTTMAGNLGLVVAGDMLSFYLFFAVMTFSAYGLVVHRRDREALRAGRIYVVLAILGELALLAGLFGLSAPVKMPAAFGVELAAAWAGVRPAHVPLVASLFALGFGVKAGIVPLHVWLPLAHPVAPTAASALLSGAMIKAGLVGWLRFLPEEQAVPALGTAFLAAGALTVFYGVAVGLAQADAKTLLAYSSVSQMGYLALCAGMALLAPGAAPVAFAAALLMARFLVLLARRADLGAGRAGQSAGPFATSWGLVLPWAALLAVGTGGGLWYPRVLALPAEVALPSIGQGIAAAALPVIAGAAAAWVLWRRPGLLGSAARLRIGAGDLLLPFEALFEALGRALPQHRRWRPVEAPLLDVKRLGERVERAAEWVARRDLRLARGALLGVALLLFGAALFLAALG